jgi:hypothetical protein
MIICFAAAPALGQPYRILVLFESPHVMNGASSQDSVFSRCGLAQMPQSPSAKKCALHHAVRSAGGEAGGAGLLSCFRVCRLRSVLRLTMCRQCHCQRWGDRQGETE